MFDDVVEFKQLSRDRELSKSEKLNPKAMLENKGGAAGLRMKMLVGGGGSSTDNMGDAQSWNAIRDKMNSSQMDGELPVVLAAQMTATAAQLPAAAAPSTATRRSPRPWLVVETSLSLYLVAAVRSTSDSQEHEAAVQLLNSPFTSRAGGRRSQANLGG